MAGRPASASASYWRSPTFYFHSIVLSSGNFSLFVLCLFFLSPVVSFVRLLLAWRCSDGFMGIRRCTTLHSSLFFSDAKKWLVIRKRRLRSHGFVRLIVWLVVLRERGVMQWISVDCLFRYWFGLFKSISLVCIQHFMKFGLMKAGRQETRSQFLTN